ncbi:MAG: cation:proton antiporter [Pseudonocardiales bacterium]|nr:cation:proton antiporter [Pseudonocardiales bacterium]
MAVVVTFGAALLVAVLFSALSERSPLSTSLIFLVAGVVAGPLMLGVHRLETETVREISSVTLFAVLFADGQRAPLAVLRDRWREPTRALLIAMPLTFVLVAALAHVLVGLDWIPSLLIGAVLAPTDPVFAAALVGRDDVPTRLRSLLNIESGLNDGLALPVVLLLIGTLGGHPTGESTAPTTLLLEITLGVVLGIVFPLATAALLRVPLIGVEPRLAPLGPLAVAVLLFVTCQATGANLYLAAFAAGITLATISPEASETFAHIGELISELAKNFALLAFGTLVTATIIADVGVSGWVLAGLTLLIGRPLPVLAALTGSQLNTSQRLAAAWFGPKGFASVVYGLIVLESGPPQAEKLFALIVATVTMSIAVHSSTDVPVAALLGTHVDDHEPATKPLTSGCTDLPPQDK